MPRTYQFLLHDGHLKAAADKIARQFGARQVNFVEPDGRRRGWFECRDNGEPFNSQTAQRVHSAIEAAGGVGTLLYARDRPAPTEGRWQIVPRLRQRSARR